MDPPDSCIAAFFDVDHTSASSNLLDAYLDFTSNGKGPVGRAVSGAAVLAKAPFYACLDWFDRVRFIKQFFKNYNGVSVETMERWARGPGLDYWNRRLFQEALRQVAWHREQGHRIALLTGGLLEMVAPLGQILQADEVLASRCSVSNGLFTGVLELGPLSGAAKAEAAEAWARESGIDLSQSSAYADDMSDLSLLELVGHPIVVNPERRMEKLARSRGWPVRRWTTRGLPT